ncbi:Origin recognition complex subunit 2 [Nymphon striatum]|nr:Origin recognition complex subunit 2 [Nymphon striatum]
MSSDELNGGSILDDCTGKEDSTKGRYSFRKRQSENRYDKSFLGRDVLSDEDDHSFADESATSLANNFSKATLFDIDYELPGSDVFTFKTPKRKNQMYNKASESAKKPSTLNSNDSEEMKCTEKRYSNTKSNKKGISDDVVTTSRSTRLRTRRQLAKRSEIVISSDEMETSSSSSSDEESADDLKAEAENTYEVNVKASNLIEEYFLAHGSSKIHTSDHTLASLNQPKINQEALQEKIKNIPKKHEKEIAHLIKRYKQLFDKWLYLLNNGYNVLLFGLGSKYELLDQFRTKHFSNSDCIVINGYFPNLSIRQILNTISEDILGREEGFSSIHEHLEYLKETYDVVNESCSRTELYIVIHNIDGSTLRRNEDQHILSILASLKNIHIVASADHINCSLLWDQTKLHLFSWLWFDVTNFELYSKETSYENSLLVQHSGKLALSSLSHVFKSLTPNAQGIFMLLSNYQLEEKENSSNYIGLSFQEYYQKCREEFLVNSDLTLRAQLTEFKDHKLIKVKKAADGVEHLSIPLDDSVLMEFVTQQQS